MEVKINASPIEKEEKKYGKFDKWEIECAVRTIIEAEEIKNDPDKMKYVLPLLKEKQTAMKKTISSIAEIREARQTLKDEE